MAKKTIPVTHIESNVPIPINRMGYPFMELDVDEMFKFPYEKHRSIRSMANRLNRLYPDRRFVVRKIDDENGGVWRTK